MNLRFPPQFVFAVLLGLAVGSSLSAADTSAALGAAADVKNSVSSSAGVQSTWGDHLQLDGLQNQLSSDAPDIEQLQQSMDRLRRVERQLDTNRTRALVAALRSWLDENPPSAPPAEPAMDAIPADEQPGAADEDADPEDADTTEPSLTTDQVVDAAADLRNWLEFYRLRTWQTILPLDALIENVRSDAPDQQAVNDLHEFLLEEIQSDTRAARVRLRRLLEDYVAGKTAPLTSALAQTTRGLKLQYRDVSESQISTLRQRTREAVRELQAWLAKGSAANRDGWTRYLKLDQMTQALQQGNRPALRDLARSYQQFNTGARGLEKQKFRNVRNALREYLEVLQFAESNAERVAAQQQRVQNALNYLDQALVQAGANKEAGWKRFLRWDDLNRMVADSSPDPRELSRMIRRLEGNEQGLELSPFRDLQRELLKHSELMQLGRGVSNVDRYRRQLERVARAIERYETESTADAAAQLGDLLSWLKTTGYAPDVVARIKAASARPNLRVTIDGQLLVDAISDTRQEAAPVNRWFERARVTGVANTTASFRGQLVPATNGIAIDILVRGSTLTTTTAQQRRVRVYTQGQTGSYGTKRIFMNLDGMFSWPATACASTHQSVCGVNVNRRCGRRLIGRFATRRAQRKAPKAESMTNREARQTLSSRLDSETEQMLSDANKRLQERLAQLRETGIYPDAVSLNSTDQRAYLVSTTAPEHYLAAPHDPPSTPSQAGGQVMAQVHESLVNNALGKRMGGTYMDNEMLVDQLREAGLEVPDELLPKAERKNPAADDEDDEPDEWSMRFDDRYPVLVRFADGKVRIAIRGREFANEEQEINELIEISANYQVDQLPDGQFQAQRLGKIEVNFVNTPGRLSTSQLSYKTFLLRKMDPLFREQFTPDDLPQTGELGELVQSIEPVEVELERGWLTAALQVDSEGLQSAFPMGR